jgi:hypothetical protein
MKHIGSQLIITIQISGLFEKYRIAVKILDPNLGVM